MKYECEIEWTRRDEPGSEGLKNYSRTHRVSMAGKPFFDLTSGMAGDGLLANPEDLLVASASSCHMLVFLALCADHGLKALSYRDHALGRLEKADGKVWVTQIELSPRVEFETPISMKKLEALHEEAHADCFIANSIRSQITIHPTAWSNT